MGSNNMDFTFYSGSIITFKVYLLKVDKVTDFYYTKIALRNI